MSVVCLIPADLDDEVASALECHFAGDGVRVVRERRHSDRRRVPRRSSLPPVVALADRRAVRNTEGRRVGDRRVGADAAAAPELPPGLARLAERLAFIDFDHPEAVRRREAAIGLRLVVRFQAGDPDAFREIYDRSFDGVYSYLLTAFRNRQEAEDGAQEVFLRALRALQRFEFRGVPFEAWLFRIVRNYTITQKERSVPETPADPVYIDRWRENRGLRSQVDGADVSDADLLLFIQRMPLPQRQVIVLRYMVGLEWNEIAVALERSSGAVRQLEQRALAYLRKRMTAVADRESAPRSQPLPMRRRGAVSPVVSRRLDALPSQIQALAG